MKIAVILGTRPEIIKLSSVIQELERENLNFFIIHTNQHYFPIMDKIFFMELGLPNFKYGLKIGSDSHGRQTGRMMGSIEDILQQEQVSHVIIQGDTNTTLAGALAASKLLNIRVAHVEAGLRSYDRKMPEEINRIITDHLSNYCFAPTYNQKKNLLREGISSSHIYVTGNTIVDAVLKYLSKAEDKSKILNKLNIKPKRYILFTLHRPENVNFKEKLTEILYTIAQFSRLKKLPVIFPTHPRTEKQFKILQLKVPSEIIKISPIGFFDFLMLEYNSKIILTDSGGVQEEACVLNVPCVTIRENTERPETLEVGANIIGGFKKSSIIRAAKIMIERDCGWNNPFGDGNAGKKIVSILKRKS